MVKVSIGMPVFNGGETLVEALSSLLSQTHKDIHIYLSDNGSTDNTSVIGRAFGQDPRVTYIRQQENIGPYRNFRTVLAAADTEYFMWAAHDDVWLPPFIERLLATLENDRGAAFAVSRYVTVSRNLGRLGIYSPPGDLRCVAEPDPGERVVKFARMKATTHKDNMVYALWRRDVLESLMDAWATFPFGEGVGGHMCEFTLAQYRGAFVDEMLFKKCYHGLAPGHPLEQPYRQMMGAKARLFGVNPNTKMYQRDQYVRQLVECLRATGLPEPIIQRAAELHE